MTYTKQEFELKVNVSLDVRKRLQYSDLPDIIKEHISNTVADFTIKKLREEQEFNALLKINQ